MRSIHWVLLAGLLAGLLDPLAAEAHGHRSHVRVHAHAVAAHARHAGHHAKGHGKNHGHAAHSHGKHGHVSSHSHEHGHQHAHAHGHLHAHAHGHHHGHLAIVPVHHGHQTAAQLHAAFHRVASGVGFWQGALDTPAGPVHFNALKVDLHMADVAPVAAQAHVGAFGLERTSAMARREHAIAGINGTFFSPRNREPMDVLIVDGRILARPVSRPALVVRPDGTASILPDHSAMRLDAMHALGGGPTLLRAGKVLLSGRPHAISGREPRTAVGLCPGGRVVLVTIDGRSRYSVGATLLEEARYMKALGARDAINLDGGGSTTMVVHGHITNHPSDGFERAVSNGLMVFPKGTYTHLPTHRTRYSGYDVFGS